MKFGRPPSREETGSHDAILDAIRTHVGDLLPAAAVVLAIGLGLWLANWLLIGRRHAKGAGLPFARQILMLLLTAVALFVALFAVPMDGDLRTGALTLITLALTVVLSMSSTQGSP